MRQIQRLASDVKTKLTSELVHLFCDFLDKHQRFKELCEVFKIPRWHNFITSPDILKIYLSALRHCDHDDIARETLLSASDDVLDDIDVLKLWIDLGSKRENSL